MILDTLHFTPGMSLLGGLLIGTASALFILANGRIAGISGILGGLLRPTSGDVIWRVAFLLGLIVAPAVLSPFIVTVIPTIDAGSTTLIIAGLLVGIGTRYGGGCTSGHGICGLSRLSPRSLIATLAFMGSGMAIVFAMRHLLIHA
jgi:uncharacterized membrane protein YedE/YeeE